MMHVPVRPNDRSVGECLLSRVVSRLLVVFRPFLHNQELLIQVPVHEGEKGQRREDDVTDERVRDLGERRRDAVSRSVFGLHFDTISEGMRRRT